MPLGDRPGTEGVVVVEDPVLEDRPVVPRTREVVTLWWVRDVAVEIVNRVGAAPRGRAGLRIRLVTDRCAARAALGRTQLAATLRFGVRALHTGRLRACQSRMGDVPVHRGRRPTFALRELELRYELLGQSRHLLVRWHRLQRHSYRRAVR